MMVRPALHLATSTDEIDLAAAEVAARDLLTALGVDLRTESLAATPGRMARAYAELLSAPPFEPTTFPNDAGYAELIIARSVPVHSICEHHLLPFVGFAHLGYLPGERLLGLSKLARVVELFARRLQVQERLTQQVADWLQEHLAADGVGVVVQAQHLCMATRGVRVNGSDTVTSAFHGRLKSDPVARAEFLAQIAAGTAGSQPPAGGSPLLPAPTSQEE